MEISKETQSGRNFRFYKVFLLLLLGFICAPGWFFAGCVNNSSLLDSASDGEGLSKTNVQEEGVDEADIVKVNAEGYIFKAQRDGVTVSRMKKADGTVEVIKKKSFEGFMPSEMFLYQDKYLIVIGGRGEIGRYFDDDGNVYNYNFDTMSVDIYDLGDLSGSGIELLRSDTFRGTYVSNMQRIHKILWILGFGGGWQIRTTEVVRTDLQFRLVKIS